MNDNGYPWMPFYGRDWSADDAIRSSQPETEGAWINTVAVMVAKETGTLTKTLAQWARMWRVEPRPDGDSPYADVALRLTATEIVDELDACDIADVVRDGETVTITSRRVSRDLAGRDTKREADRKRQAKSRGKTLSRPCHTSVTDASQPCHTDVTPMSQTDAEAEADAERTQREPIGRTSLQEIIREPKLDEQAKLLWQQWVSVVDPKAASKAKAWSAIKMLHVNGKLDMPALTEAMGNFVKHIGPDRLRPNLATWLAGDYEQFMPGEWVAPKRKPAVRGAPGVADDIRCKADAAKRKHLAKLLDDYWQTKLGDDDKRHWQDEAKARAPNMSEQTQVAMAMKLAYEARSKK